MNSNYSTTNFEFDEINHSDHIMNQRNGISWKVYRSSRSKPAQDGNRDQFGTVSFGLPIPVRSYIQQIL